MSPAWLLFALVAPVALAVAAGLLRPPSPRAQVTVTLGALVPGAGLAWAGRPLLETVLGVLLAQVSLVLVGRPGDLGMYLPVMGVGALWTSLYTELSPLKKLTESAAAPAYEASPPAGNSLATPPAIPAAAGGHAAARSTEPAEPGDDSGYSVAVRCTECGADVEVSVLQHMADCSWCGSRHVVVGHDEILHLTLPEKVTGDAGVRAAVLDHYRYARYIELYKRHVAPLERQATMATPDGKIVDRPEIRAAAAAAEARITRQADDYRARLDTELRLGELTHFLAPYWHGMGTLYEAAFGRSPRDQEKQLAFAIGTVEASSAANATVELPGMGRLSYLRALQPAERMVGRVPTLPVQSDVETLTGAYGNLDRKQLVRNLQVIRLGTAFQAEVSALLWRPWWTASVEAPGVHETLLVDAAAGSVAGHAPAIDPAALTELAVEDGGSLRFVPMQCPVCGFEFSFDRDAVLHFCSSCHRLFGVRGGSKLEVPYLRPAQVGDAEVDLLPFWRFPLRLRTADGALLTDMAHLKDGIDGTLDQIGEDAPMGHDHLLVPAVRLINSKLMTRAFNRLFLHAANHPYEVLENRFPLEDRVAPLTVSLSECEARALGPLYLANAFSRRDLARVNIHQVGSWLFEARLESAGQLAYLPVPRAVTEPFRRYLGRFRAAAVADVTK